MVEITDLYKSYNKPEGFWKKQKRQVLSGIRMEIKKGKSIGLIGESGSGKSTLSRIILGLEKPDSGQVLIEGVSVNEWLKTHRGGMSVVFQDYNSSVNPYYTVKQIIAEPLYANSSSYRIQDKVQDKIRELLQQVGLSESIMEQYPHELSGGQLQRVCIARAISTKPKFLVLDEAVSSLDASVQAQVLELLEEIRLDMKMTYLFISHDLLAVTKITQEIYFIDNGRIVESCLSSEIGNVKHETACRLLDAVMPFQI